LTNITEKQKIYIYKFCRTNIRICQIRKRQEKWKKNMIIAVMVNLNGPEESRMKYFPSTFVKN